MKRHADNVMNAKDLRKTTDAAEEKKQAQPARNQQQADRAKK